MSPRWIKPWRDAWAERGRFAAMIAAIAVSLVAVGGVLGAYAVLTREISRNYLQTQPADATIALGAPVDADTLAAVRARPEVAVAEVGEVLRARFAVGEGEDLRWRPVLVFVVDDPADQTLAITLPVDGSPREGAVAIERTAAALFDLGIGDTVRLRLADNRRAELPIAAVVHDPGLAPAWQERLAYVYVSRATLDAAVGTPVGLHDLRIRFADREDTADVDRLARALGQALSGPLGAEVHEIRVPPFGQHPHQRQMTTMLALFVAFAALALALSAILVATSLAAMLARQVREIGVLKTLGASPADLARMYAVLIGGVGAVAVAVALPIGALVAAQLSGAVAGLLNFELASRAAPAWVWAVQVAAGVGVPLAFAAAPIARATRITVREALDPAALAASLTLGARFARWPRPVRARLRRPARTALTIGLLAAAGAMFVTARSVSAGWTANVAKVASTRFDDVELRFAAPVPASVADAVAVIPGVRRVEAWDYAPAALADDAGVEVSRTWPDRGHGSLAWIAIPPDTALVRFPVVAGRWFAPGDRDVAVVNQGAQRGRDAASLVGAQLDLAVEGEVHRVTVVGVIEEIGSPGAVYVPRAPGSTLSMLRVAAADVAAVERAVDDTPIDAVIPRAELVVGVGGHVALLVSTLTALALVMATVGGLGLGSVTAIEVAERTREVGVLKTLGATPGQVAAQFVTEALILAAASVPAALIGAVGLTLAVDALVGRLGFLAPLPFVFAWDAAGVWLGIAGIVSIVAALSPASRAGALTVTEALAAT